MRKAPAPGSRPSPTARLIVDPVACDGVGMCAHLAPMLILLDSWGYPIVPRTPLEGSDRRAAQAAVAGCPRRALELEPLSRSIGAGPGRR